MAQHGPVRGGAHLAIHELSKRFGAFTAVDRVSLEVMDGEFLCILGPSGCGKTTILRMIAGLEEASHGRILQGGRDITRLPPSGRDFGLVFQSYALFPNLTVRDNIAYGLRGSGLGRRGLRRAELAARVEAMLALVGMPEQGTKYPAQLSGGQQQRVALARALAPSPLLLLLDEPLSALDAKVRARLRGEMKALQRRLGITSIMVTHDQEEALSMADRIVVMDRGRIAQIGTPQEIYHSPASALVADFIGQMNFLPGTALPGRQVACGPLRLACRRDGAGRPPSVADGPVTVAVRPEDIRIEPGSTAPGDASAADAAGENRLAAAVLGVEFLGPVLRLRLQPADMDGIALLADMPIHAARAQALGPGERVIVHLPAERLHLYPGEPAR